MDFIFATLPSFRLYFKRFLLPLISVLCEEISKIYASIRSYNEVINQNNNYMDDRFPNVDVLILLFGLEKIIVFVLGEGEHGHDMMTSGSAAGSLKVWADYVAGVITGDLGADDPTYTTVLKVRYSIIFFFSFF